MTDLYDCPRIEAYPSRQGHRFTLGVEGFDATSVADALEDRDLDAVSVRGNYSLFAEDLDAVLETYAPLNVDTVVVSGFDDDLDSRDRALSAAADLSGIADEVGTHGMGLCVHNHGGLFERMDDSSPFEVIVAETDDVHLELDVGWLAHDGRDPAAIVARYADRIDVLHVADYHPDHGLGVDLGEGIVDLAAVGRAARDADVDWLVYDCDDPHAIPDLFAHAADVIEGLAGG